jgi:hypothetical protein
MTADLRREEIARIRDELWFLSGTQALDDYFGDTARLAQLVYALLEGKFTEAINLAEAFQREHRP